MVIEFPDALVKKYQEAKTVMNELSKVHRSLMSEYWDATRSKDQEKVVKATANSEALGKKYLKAQNDAEVARTEIYELMLKGINPNPK
jgi:uncharacterized protein YbaP (TraB family)